MLFYSLAFIVFFTCIIAAYYLLPHRYRWILLLLASYFFYATFRIEYVIFLFGSTLTSFLTGLQVGKTGSEKIKKRWVAANVIANLLLLFVFKYYDFAIENINGVLDAAGSATHLSTLDLLLPIGISFYTFQSIGYTLDVYYETRDPEKHFGLYATYIAFFPKLVAGPIERSTNLLPQLHRKISFDYTMFINGLRLVLWGFFKKLVIADRLAIMVDFVYNDAGSFEGLPLIIATVLYAFQVFCDFSAYSDIAIGLSLMLGFKLVENFNRPYFSKSVSEYWRRWHMSMINWFNLYLYTPLVVHFKKYGKSGIILSIFITFLLSGLWHGPAWTYVIWGGLQAAAIAYETLTKKKRTALFKKMPVWLAGAVGIAATFSFICFTDIFFRANSISDAFHIVSHLFTGLGEDILSVAHNTGFSRMSLLYLGQESGSFIMSIALVLFLLLVMYKQDDERVEAVIARYPAWFRISVYYLLLWSLFYLAPAESQQFIYFQF